MYKKLQEARVEVQKRATKKSGENKYAGFKYFELGDFLPIANEEFAKVGLTPIFTIKTERHLMADGQIIEQENAYLDIHDDDKFIRFETPTANANVKGANDIQNLGSKHTYLKRYLYMNALELSESDAVDATIGKEEKKDEPKATNQQVEKIKFLYDEENIEKALAYYKVEKIEDLTLKNASEMIAKKKGK